MKKFFNALFDKETWSEFFVDAKKVFISTLIAVVVMAAVVGVLYLTIAK